MIMHAQGPSITLNDNHAVVVETAEQLNLEKGVLSLPQATGIALASGTGLPLTMASSTGFVVLFAGNGSWLILLVMLLSCFGIVGAINYFARKHVVTGSMQSFLALGAPPWARTTAAAALVLAYLVCANAGYITIYLQSFLIDLGLDIALYPWAQNCITVLFAMILMAISYRGIRANTNIIIAVGFVAVPLEIFITFAAAHRNGIALHELLTLQNTSRSGLFLALPIAIGLLAGFEGVSSLGVETKDPTRNIPRVLILTISITAIVLLLWAVLQTHSLVLGESDLLRGLSPTAVLAEQGGVAWIKPWVDGLLTIGEVAVVLGGVNFSTRIMGTIAKDGYLPRFLSDIHPKYKTPYKSILTVIPLSTLLFIGVQIAGGGSPVEVIVEMGGALFYFFAVPYVLICGIVIYKRIRSRDFRSISLYGALLSIGVTMSVVGYNLYHLAKGIVGTVTLLAIAALILLTTLFLFIDKRKRLIVDLFIRKVPRLQSLQQL